MGDFNISFGGHDSTHNTKTNDIMRRFPFVLAVVVRLLNLHNFRAEKCTSVWKVIFGKKDGENSPSSMA